MMNVYVSSSLNDEVIMFYNDEDAAIRYGRPYFKTTDDKIPEGEGRMRTDCKGKIWFEPIEPKTAETAEGSYLESIVSSVINNY